MVAQLPPVPHRPEADAPVPPSGMAPDHHIWRLYVAGSTIKSMTALRNLRQICETYLPGHYDIEVVDLVANPKLAADDQILALPTLVRRKPPPPKRIIGDLANTEKVLLGLDIAKSPKP